MIQKGFLHLFLALRGRKKQLCLVLERLCSAIPRLDQIGVELSVCISPKDHQRGRSSSRTYQVPGLTWGWRSRGGGMRVFPCRAHALVGAGATVEKLQSSNRVAVAMETRHSRAEDTADSVVGWGSGQRTHALPCLLPRSRTCWDPEGSVTLRDQGPSAVLEDNGLIHHLSSSLLPSPSLPSSFFPPRSLSSFLSSSLLFFLPSSFFLSSFLRFFFPVIH